MKTITKEQKEFLNKYTLGTWKLNSNTGLVDINGNFSCSRRGLSDFLGIEFGTVEGYFDCSNNKLVSLEGAPIEVRGYFDCSSNQLVSLVGAPQEVRGNFNCSHNKLVSLEGAPQKVGWDFFCDPLPLRGCPSNLLKRIYFSKDIKEVSLSDVIRNIDDINRFYLEIYLKKMI